MNPVLEWVYHERQSIDQPNYIVSPRSTATLKGMMGRENVVANELFWGSELLLYVMPEDVSKTS